MANNPTLLAMPLCKDADKNVIPETDNGTTGLFSQQYGWQNINSLPLSAGGKAVNRQDFNGALNLLGGIVYMAQKGYTFEWDATQDYVVGCKVIDPTDGKKYECVSDVTANVTPPSADSTHWKLATDIAWFIRQPSTPYAQDEVVYLPSMGAGLYLECTTAGTTDSGDLVISTPTPNDTVTDGTVTWTIKKIGSGSGVPIGIIEPFAGNGQIPEGYLLCDGSAVSRTMYPDLFTAIGTASVHS